MGNGYLLNAAVKINLDGEAKEALKSGVELNFYYEFKAGLEKKYLHRRLSYNHLSNNYRLDFLEEQKSRSFKDLNSALKALDLSNVIMEFKNHNPVMRLSLAKFDLPFSLRFNAMVNNDWNLTSGWKQLCSI